jgi:hypothetical protein
MKNFTVWHAVEPTFFARQKPLIGLSINVEVALRRQGYVQVADVEAEALGEVFQLTNHIDSDWRTNARVSPYECAGRSTSVGDIVVDLQDKAVYEVAFTGFTRLN